ncbi:MAG: hypothetical protein R2940_05575 [Syntrophotaleaceae bacterium]
MVNGKQVIIGVYLKDRQKEATEVQKYLTDYGCYIAARIGLHEVTGNFCAGYGLLLLHMFGEEKFANELVGVLNAIQGVEAKKLVFGAE